MKKKFALIGLGRFGRSICHTLIDAGQEVLVIDSNKKKINEFNDIATHAVLANAQDEQILRSVGIRNFDHVIIAIGEDIQASILVALMIKDMGVPFVTAKAQNEYHGKVLEKIGVDYVIHPERDSGIRIAHQVVSKNIIDYLKLSDEYSLVELKVTNSFFYNKSLVEIDFRVKFGLVIIGIRRNVEIIISPKAEECIKENDSLILVGGIDNLDRLEAIMS